MENKRTNYSKESTKSKPSGVRFDLEKLAFIQSKEKQLNTKQKVVDFLLNNYWWQHKVHKPTHKDVPPIEEEENTYAEVNYVKATEVLHPIMPEMPQPKILTVAQWLAKKREIESDELYAKFLDELNEAYYLSDKQKNQIKTTP